MKMEFLVSGISAIQLNGDSRCLLFCGFKVSDIDTAKII